MCNDCDWSERLKQCGEMLDELDELPDRATEFAESVREKVQSISEWIETNEHVTDRQGASLDNMQSGVRRWLDR